MIDALISVVTPCANERDHHHGPGCGHTALLHQRDNGGECLGFLVDGKMECFAPAGDETFSFESLCFHTDAADVDATEATDAAADAAGAADCGHGHGQGDHAHAHAQAHATDADADADAAAPHLHAHLKSEGCCDPAQAGKRRPVELSRRDDLCTHVRLPGTVAANGNARPTGTTGATSTLRQRKRNAPQFVLRPATGGADDRVLERAVCGSACADACEGGKGTCETDSLLAAPLRSNASSCGDDACPSEKRGEWLLPPPLSPCTRPGYKPVEAPCVALGE